MTKRRSTAKTPLRVVVSDPLSLLRSELSKARAEGWEIRVGIGIIVPHMRRADPVGVLLRGDPARFQPLLFLGRVAEILGWPRQRAIDFHAGFIGRPMETSGLIAHHEDAWRMGREYRAEVDRSGVLG